MKKEILKLFYIPIFLFILASFVYIFSFFFVLENHFSKYQNDIKQIVLHQKKNEIKNEINNFKGIFNLLKNTIYSATNEEFLTIINTFIQNNFKNFIVTDSYIIGLIPKNKKFKYEVYKNRYILLDYKNKKYLSVLKNKNRDVYVLGVRKELIDKIVIENILKYLDKINKNNPSYIALGKIITFNPKNGIFGYIYYMPPKLKFLEGKELSLNKPDKKGNFYRKKYFKCLKENKGCFVSYYHLNPITNKIEEKISYVDLIGEYNLTIVKGIYKSQILNAINKKISYYKKQYLNIFVLGFFIYFIVLVLFVVLEILILKKVTKKLINDFYNLKNNLIKSVYYDNLTKLPNRNKLLKDIKNFNSLILIDIEDFSDINDVFGFEVGDEILIKFSKYLQDYFKTSVYRIGSDEFAVASEINFTQSMIKNFIDKNVKFNGINLDFVIGVSSYKKRLLETAEMALKLAFKEKKKYVIYDENVYIKQREKLSKLNLLKEALQNKDIIPYYQCIVDKNGKVIKYEALMRIKIGNEIKSPFYFLDTIKEAKLYNEFSKIMICKVLKDLKYLDKKVSINLSFADIENLEMREFILNSINDENSKKIVFEILESEGILNFDLVVEFINEVKKRGVEIAIDDFGSGYSNFVRILGLSPDIVKIDATIIKNLQEEKYKKIVELIIDFAQSFNLKTVAEFVSDKEKFEILKNLGIDEFQGFYFCEPKPLENIVKKDKISSKKGNNEN